MHVYLEPGFAANAEVILFLVHDVEHSITVKVLSYLEVGNICIRDGIVDIPLRAGAKVDFPFLIEDAIPAFPVTVSDREIHATEKDQDEHSSGRSASQTGEDTTHR
jgi:hypothetical protein